MAGDSFNIKGWRPLRTPKPKVGQPAPMNPYETAWGNRVGGMKSTGTLPAWSPAPPYQTSPVASLKPGPRLPSETASWKGSPTLLPADPPPDPQAQYKQWMQYAKPIIDEMMAGGMPNGSESASFYGAFGPYLDAAVRNKGQVQIANAQELAQMMKAFSEWERLRRAEANPTTGTLQLKPGGWSADRPLR